PYPTISPLTEKAETWVVLARLIQDSMVKFWSWRPGGLPIHTPSPFPSNVKACPTRPSEKPAFPRRLPLFPPITSKALPFAGHQPTSPAGAGTQVGEIRSHLPALPAL